MADEQKAQPLQPLLGWLAPYLNAPVDVLRGLVAGSEDTPWAKAGVLLGALPPLKPLGALAGLKKGAQEAAEAATTGIRAYHGSPHEFEQFSLGKIGTGEGAQAYGHGLYFAENEDVAKAYRDTVGASGHQVRYGDVEYPSGTIQNSILRDIQKNGKAWTIKDQEGTIRFLENYAPDQANLRKSYLDWLKNIDESKVHVGKGRMYEVNIRAHLEDFLDWDKPLSEQSPRVREALREHLEQLTAQGQTVLPDILQQVEAGTLPGSSVYHAFGRGTPESATAALKSRGIPGIKYLDQMSRATSGGELIDTFEKNGQWFAKIRKPNVSGGIGNAPADMFTTSMPLPSKEAATKWASEQISQGTRNFVVVDDALVSILRKYGLLPPIAAGTLGLSQLARPSQQGQP
jgi:hypothetical protein